VPGPRLFLIRRPTDGGGVLDADVALLGHSQQDRLGPLSTLRAVESPYGESSHTDPFPRPPTRGRAILKLLRNWHINPTEQRGRG
jgi:hypothetical protein